MTPMEALIYAAAFGAVIASKEHPALAAAAGEFAVTELRALGEAEVMTRFPNMGPAILKAHSEAVAYGQPVDAEKLANLLHLESAVRREMEHMKSLAANLGAPVDQRQIAADKADYFKAILMESDL